MSEYRPVTLVILDGWGESPEPRGNAVLGANLPTINELNQYYPKITLQASGIAVGLPWLQAGNSEVGHQIIGTGQVIFQYLPLISNAISSGTFFKNQVLLDALQSVKEKKSRLHLIGLTSNGGVHSHLDHLFALLELSRWQGLSAQTFIHVITDGRDTPIHNAGQFISRIQAATGGNIATIMGRYYAMDRNNNWDRIQKAYLALTEGKGIPERDPLGAINKQYEENLGDEHIKPIVIIDKENRPVATINENDTVIFYNFRKDRARQLTEAFVTPGFQPFPQKKYQHLKFVCFAEYKEGLKVDIAFPPQKNRTPD